jgi:hypothetical protein
MCTDTFIANDKKGLTTAKSPLFVIHRLTLIVIVVALSLTLCGPELELHSHAKERREGAFMLPPRLMPELEVLLLQNRRARTRESAVCREGDHTGIVDEETTLTRTTDGLR